MKLKFYKYEGAGNDFILVDNRENIVEAENAALNSRLCHRHFGIGADGIMFLQNKEGFDFEMLYYNSDGQLSSMCGNGGRCIASFAKRLGIFDSEATFLAVDGPHYAKVSEDGTWVSLKMIDVDAIHADHNAYVLNTGSPHYVLPANELRTKDVYKEGKAIRNTEPYHKEGINVNFVEDFDSHYFVRTYERGVEDETFACGTGATAAALAMAKQKNQTGDITTPIEVLGGNLNIRFNYNGSRFSNIFLEGPAKFVFEGEVEIG